MDDLITWLRAQLDQQEAALIAYRDHRAGLTPCVNVEGDDPEEFPYDKYDSCAVHLSTAEATEYRNVEYGLAEVDTKRRVLTFHESEDWDDNMVHVVRLIAQPYAGRDGWRNEWTTTEPT